MKLIKYLGATFSFLIGVAALAGGPPSMFNSCEKEVNIRLPKKSNGFYFSEDCKTIYILPPAVGILEMTRPSRSPVIELCESINGLQAQMKMKTQKINRLIRELGALESQVTLTEENDPWLGKPRKSPGEDNEDNEEKEDKLHERIAKLSEELESSINKFLKSNETFAQYEGPRVGINLDMGHNALLRDFQKLNPGLNIVKMPLAKGVLSFIRRNDQNIGKASAVLNWDIAGVHVSPRKYLSVVDLADVKDEVDPNAAILFSSSASGQILFSLIGACPFYDTRNGGMPETISQKDLEQYIRATGDYIYNVTANRFYKAEYNLGALVKRMQKQKRKGGFFTSKTIHSLIVERDSRGWFKFESYSQDNRMDWDDQLAQTIKAQLIARVLDRLGAVPVGKGESPELLRPGMHGSQVAVEGLSKCSDLYCQAAGFIIKTLDSTIGSDTAIANYIEKQDHWEVEEVRERRMFPRSNQVSF